MTKWPPIRIGALIGISLVILYGLGRWDGLVSARYSELRDDTRVILDLGKAARRRSDSLRLLERAALAQAQTVKRLEDSLETRLGSLDARDLQEVADIQSLSLRALLPPLRMQPIVSEGQISYATDSAGVRFLSGRMLRLSQLERRLPVADSLARSRAGHVVLLEAASGAASARADSAESRVGDLEKQLERWLDASSCHILLPFIPCPSRGLSFVGGVAVTIVAVVLIR